MALVGSIEKVRGSRMAIPAEAGHDADDHPHQHPDGEVQEVDRRQRHREAVDEIRENVHRPYLVHDQETFWVMDREAL